MKTIPIATHIATKRTTLAEGLKLVRPDAAVYAFTSHDVNDPISGVTYKSKPGLSVTDIVTNAGAAVGNLELTTLHDGTIFTTADILGGRWRGTEFTLFRYNHQDLTSGIDILLSGIIGEVKIQRNFIIIELRDWRQFYQFTVGAISSKNCRARLGDALCTKDISGFAITELTITNVTDNRIFTVSGLSLALHWLSNGYLTWTFGPNAGLKARIRYYDDGSGGGTNGTFFLASPMLSTVSIGDKFIPVVGCLLRFEEDCIGKFGNGLNFQGEPHRIGINSLTAPPPPIPVDSSDSGK